MKKLELTKEEKADAIRRIQVYFDDELEQDIGALPAELLLDFFSELLGPDHYNRGLRDAHSALLAKVDDLSEALYLLEEPKAAKR